MKQDMENQNTHCLCHYFIFYFVRSFYILSIISSVNLPGQLEIDLLSVGAGGDLGGYTPITESKNIATAGILIEC